MRFATHNALYIFFANKFNFMKSFVRIYIPSLRTSSQSGNTFAEIPRHHPSHTTFLTRRYAAVQPPRPSTVGSRRHLLMLLEPAKRPTKNVRSPPEGREGSCWFRIEVKFKRLLQLLRLSKFRSFEWFTLSKDFSSCLFHLHGRKLHSTFHWSTTFRTGLHLLLSLHNNLIHEDLWTQIPSELRYAWHQQMFPIANTVLGSEVCYCDPFSLHERIRCCICIFPRL